jgi:hypothetical protein
MIIVRWFRIQIQITIISKEKVFQKSILNTNSNQIKFHRLLKRNNLSMNNSLGTYWVKSLSTMLLINLTRKPLDMLLNG